MPGITHYPPELLSLICSHIFSYGHPVTEPSLDPVAVGEHGITAGCTPLDSWSEPVARRTLVNLCLVSHAWYGSAKPWLWQKVEVRLPRNWLAFVEELSNFEEEVAAAGLSIAAGTKLRDPDLRVAPGSSSDPSPVEQEAQLQIRKHIMDPFVKLDTCIPVELLSPPASRDPSPRRLRGRSKSPASGINSFRPINGVLESIYGNTEYGLYVQEPYDPSQGRYVRHLDFNHFRTIGMRHSVSEGMNSRFVTEERLQAVLKEMPNLLVLGATEYMDSALTLPVIQELLLRGLSSARRGRISRARGRGSSTGDIIEDMDRERRAQFLELEALDLTGCVSGAFASALTEFVKARLVHQPVEDHSSSGSEDEGGSNGRRSPRWRSGRDEPLAFRGLRRLGLRGVKSIQPDILTPFVLAFPFLTHLDLSGTRATPDLLYELGRSPTVRLCSLSLARCVALTGDSIADFLINAPAASEIRELNLYGDMSFRSPLTENDLRNIFENAPCFISKELVYLDLSSASLTAEVLRYCPPLLRLRSLGLSYIPNISLDVIADFVKSKTPNAEVLTLVSTSPDIECGTRTNGANVLRGSPRQASLALHSKIIQPLCTPQLSFRISQTPQATSSPPTRLRVIELAMSLAGTLSKSAGPWRFVRSKGGRGWYVDAASGWTAEGAGLEKVLRRDLEKGHPLREGIERLADANGNVSSGVGWHARKMEILQGQGMLGREDGLYGAVSFAYQG